MPDCYIDNCKKTFMRMSALYKHLRDFHEVKHPHHKGKIFCPLNCGEKLTQLQKLRRHLETDHDITVECEIQEFPNLERFEVWKRNVEVTTGHLYIRQMSTRKLMSGRTHTWLHCHRSGISLSRSTGKRRRNPTKKMGSTCPAVMDVTHDASIDGSVKVIFWKTHVGHESEEIEDATLAATLAVPRKKKKTKAELVGCDVCAILPAAGTGERMGLDKPKQYTMIHQKPIICYTAESFLRLPYVKKVVVVASGDNLVEMLHLLTSNCELIGDKLVVTEGSSSRHGSIDAGLRALKTHCGEESVPEIVIVHDGVRPFIREDHVLEVVMAAKEHGASGTTCPLVSTVLLADENGFMKRALNRNKYKASEMPQAFRFDILRKAYDECSIRDYEKGTEVLHLVQKYAGVMPKLVPAVMHMWKLTHKKDIYAAAGVVKENQAVGLVIPKFWEDLRVIITTSLLKKFHRVNVSKSLDSSIATHPNLVHVHTSGDPYDVLLNLQLTYSSIEHIDQISSVHIMSQSTDLQINARELQKQAKECAVALREMNVLAYFIMWDTIKSSGEELAKAYEDTSEMVTSLLFDSNPHIIGTIFYPCQ